MDAAHQIAPDGYCETCGTVGCRDKASQPRRGNVEQLNRIELKVNRVLRHLGLDTETETTQ